MESSDRSGRNARRERNDERDRMVDKWKEVGGVVFNDVMMIAENARRNENVLVM